MTGSLAMLGLLQSVEDLRIRIIKAIVAGRSLAPQKFVFINETALSQTVKQLQAARIEIGHSQATKLDEKINAIYFSCTNIPTTKT